MEQKLSDTLVKAIDRSNPMMQNLQLASRFNKLIDESGSGADLEDNKEATIDVSAYTEPVEIEPTEGKDGMKKATVTLSNIPSGGDIEANKEATIDVSTYTEPVEIIPTAGKDGMAKATVTLTNIPSDVTSGFAIEFENGDSDGYIFSKIIAFGNAQAINEIPAGTYNAFFVTDDVVEGETHDFTDIPHLFQETASVSATSTGSGPSYYAVTISENVTPINSGEYGTVGRHALLVLYPSNI